MKRNTGFGLMTLAARPRFGSGHDQGVHAAAARAKLTKVTLQLKWVTQAQFAGYYAAAAEGYYKDARGST